jgi:glycosyltransferase involved in cell wall biosynthesis
MDFPQDSIEVIIVINGAENKESFNKLQKEYAYANNVRLVFTERKGPGIARNIGMGEAKNTWLTILDDDDYFTRGAFAEAEKLAADDVDIIQMKCFDSTDGIINEDTYINKTIKYIIEKCKSMVVEDYSIAASILGNNATKLYRKTLWEKFSKIPEDLMHTEDVYFWAENYANITGKIAVFPCDSAEGYIREVHSSLSRPDTDDGKERFISDKFDIIGQMSDMYDRADDKAHRDFIMRQIRAQEQYIIGELKEPLAKSIRALAENHLRKFDNTKLRQAPFASCRGIVFTYYGIPEDDVSAYMSAKRLKEINEFLGEIVQWNVYKKDSSNIRGKDMVFNNLFANRFCHSVKTVCGKEPSSIGINAFVEKTLEQTILFRAKYIYSRSMPPHGHMAAYRYKKHYPDVKWFAEFSDPISRNTENQKREKYGDEYEMVEQIVYEHADHIIFTNKNQLEYMLSYNCHPELNEKIIKKALVWPHPTMEAYYTNIIKSDYALEQEKINIAYFGAFYKPNRDHSNLLRFLKNENVVLHIFCQRYYGGGSRDDITRDAYSLGYDVSNVRVNGGVSLFEMLNIASRMDYLYLEDTNFPGELNPYLPSKYADYKTACSASCTKIIANVYSGSVLSATDEACLVRVSALTDEFICGLVKQIV